jgi:hypothetical protein
VIDREREREREKERERERARLVGQSGRKSVSVWREDE